MFFKCIVIIFYIICNIKNDCNILYIMDNVHSPSSSSMSINNNTPDSSQFQVEIIDFPDEKNNNQTQDDSNKTSDYFDKYMSGDNSRVTWSRSDEKVVKKYITKAVVYKALYNYSFFYYTRRYQFIIVPLVIATCISIGMQTISTTLLTSDSVNKNNGSIISIITTATSIFVMILTYVHSKTGYDHKSRGCRKAGYSFSEFADQLKTLLIINKERRSTPSETLKFMNNDFNKLIKTFEEFEIPAAVYKTFLSINKNNSDLIDVALSGSELNMYDNPIERGVILNNFLDNLVELRRKNDMRKSSLIEPFNADISMA
jgi:hypothetical protein